MLLDNAKSLMMMCSTVYVDRMSDFLEGSVDRVMLELQPHP